MATMETAPLVPGEIDLRDFPFMPLDVVRLRDSRLAAISSGDEFMAWIILACASWHQRPAGSLPNDDVELSRLAGFGRAVREWMKVREGALHGWVLCSDGRFYHPVIAEKALEAWAEKYAYRERRAKRIASAKAAAAARWDSEPRCDEDCDDDAEGTPDASQSDANRIPIASQSDANRNAEGMRDAMPKGTGTGTGTGIVGKELVGNTESEIEDPALNVRVPQRGTNALRVSVSNGVDLDVEFEEWWAGVWRKRDKGHARKAYVSIRRKGKATRDELFAGRDAYKRQAPADPTYQCYPATWLNGERWKDEAEPTGDERAEATFQRLMGGDGDDDRA